MAKTKLRADQLLYDQGHVESRERGKRLIMAGRAYYLDGDRRVPIDKPGRQFAEDVELGLTEPERFVSRGGYKLLTAIEAFGVDFTGKVVLDAGSSTGGFTDCALQHGAVRVYAVDVGKAQLHERMLADDRVVSMEGVNLRHAPEDLLPERVDVVVSDVSFISLTKVMPACTRFLKPGGEVVALIKPQFEVGPHQTDKGVVRDEGARLAAVDAVVRFCEEELSLSLVGSAPSRIKGPKGNQEYLAYFRLRSPVS